MWLTNVVANILVSLQWAETGWAEKIKSILAHQETTSKLSGLQTDFIICDIAKKLG